MKEAVTAIIVIFLGFQTVNWFVLQAYRIKLDYQKTPVTQQQRTGF